MRQLQNARRLGTLEGMRRILSLCIFGSLLAGCGMSGDDGNGSSSSSSSLSTTKVYRNQTQQYVISYPREWMVIIPQDIKDESVLQLQTPSGYGSGTQLNNARIVVTIDKRTCPQVGQILPVKRGNRSFYKTQSSKSGGGNVQETTMYSLSDSGKCLSMQLMTSRCLPTDCDPSRAAFDTGGLNALFEGIVDSFRWL